MVTLNAMSIELCKNSCVCNSASVIRFNTGNRPICRVSDVGLYSYSLGLNRKFDEKLEENIKLFSTDATFGFC